MSSSPKRIAIFCDGTWCGRETDTRSNIQILAEMVGRIDYSTSTSFGPTAIHPIIPHQAHLQPNIVAGYQEGVGLNKTFLEYLWDGATASTIGEDENDEIWMFGFSRGAYTVRCVAGMINNCGILKRNTLDEKEIETLCQAVYKTYRSPLDIDRPKSDRCNRLRGNKKNVWQNPRPVRLMVIGDTVGSLGIPRLNAGIGFDWPEFYDQKISTVVKEVYHAPAVHDRLWIFQPCLAYNGEGEDEVVIHQKWFPGCHYDLGRQKFRFVRQAPANKLESVIGALPGRLAKTVWPNEILADVCLRWMLEAVSATEGGTSLIPDVNEQIIRISSNIAIPETTQPIGPTGSGDVYGDVLAYAPGGVIFSSLAKFGSKAVDLLNKAVPKLGDNIQDLLGVKTILRILTSTRDRRIPGNDHEADVYAYKDMETVVVNEEEVRFSVAWRADIDGDEEECDGKREARYPSRTFESWELWRRVFGTA